MLSLRTPCSRGRGSPLYLFGRLVHECMRCVVIALRLLQWDHLLCDPWQDRVTAAAAAAGAAQRLLTALGALQPTSGLCPAGLFSDLRA